MQLAQGWIRKGVFCPTHPRHGRWIPSMSWSTETSYQTFEADLTPAISTTHKPAPQACSFLAHRWVAVLSRKIGQRHINQRV